MMSEAVKVYSVETSEFQTSRNQKLLCCGFDSGLKLIEIKAWRLSLPQFTVNDCCRSSLNAVTFHRLRRSYYIYELGLIGYAICEGSRGDANLFTNFYQVLTVEES